MDRAEDVPGISEVKAEWRSDTLIRLCNAKLVVVVSHIQLNVFHLAIVLITSQGPLGVGAQGQLVKRIIGM